MKKFNRRIMAIFMLFATPLFFCAKAEGKPIPLKPVRTCLDWLKIGMAAPVCAFLGTAALFSTESDVWGKLSYPNMILTLPTVLASLQIRQKFTKPCDEKLSCDEKHNLDDQVKVVAFSVKVASAIAACALYTYIYNKLK